MAEQNREMRPPCRPEVDRFAAMSKVRMILVALGASLGFVSAVGIYFDPAEPYPGFVTIAGTLHGIVTALLLTTTVSKESTVAQSLLWGVLYGLLTGSMGFFAEGAWASWDAPYIVPTAIVVGVILGPVVRLVSRRAT